MAVVNTNQQVSSPSDFMTKLASWLVGTVGWTGEAVTGATNGHNATTGIAAWSIAAFGSNTNDVQVAFQYDTVTPDNVGVYQYNHASGAGNYNNANAPYAQATDSGSGDQSAANATLDDGRHIELTATPTQFWGFASTGSFEKYANIVVETSADTYVHLNFGELVKFNDWTGGAYCCGSRWGASGFNNSVAIHPASCHLLEGLASETFPVDIADYCSTMNVEGLSDSPAGGMWGAVCNIAAAADLHNDRQTVPVARVSVLGGWRAGPHAMLVGGFPGTTTLGYLPGYPIVCYHMDKDVSGSSVESANSVAPLGYMPDARGVNMENFVAGDEVTIGSETWIMFPTRSLFTGTLTGSTGYQGMLYRKS